MIGRIGLIELGIGLIELGKGLIELGIGLIELGIGLIELGIGLIELGKGLMELGIGLRIITPGAPSWPVYPALFFSFRYNVVQGDLKKAIMGHAAKIYIFHRFWKMM